LRFSWVPLFRFLLGGFSAASAQKLDLLAKRKSSGKFKIDGQRTPRVSVQPVINNARAAGSTLLQKIQNLDEESIYGDNSSALCPAGMSLSKAKTMGCKAFLNRFKLPCLH
jgi:hypothetical protein